LGDRKRLIKAVGGLVVCTNASKSGDARALPGVDTAERRQLTVMFCDLVGSTAISARLDPEDTRQVIRAYQDVCSGIIARYSGFVAKFMGDGVLAYFSFPRAHEDDAERAVRAGLEIAVAVAKLETRAIEPLRTRIGIATGLVVVGELVGQGSAQEQAVVGDTPNLAARLQGLAEPGSMVIDGCLATCLTCAISADLRSRASQSRSPPGRSKAWLRRKAVSKQHARRGRRASSGGRRRAQCCSSARTRRGMARARSC